MAARAELLESSRAAGLLPGLDWDPPAVQGPRVTLEDTLVCIRWPGLFTGPCDAQRFRDALIALGQMGHRIQLMATALALASFLSSGVRYPLQEDLFGVPFAREGVCYMVALG